MKPQQRDGFFLVFFFCNFAVNNRANELSARSIYAPNNLHKYKGINQILDRSKRQQQKKNNIFEA